MHNQQTDYFQNQLIYHHKRSCTPASSPPASLFLSQTFSIKFGLQLSHTMSELIQITLTLSLFCGVTYPQAYTVHNTHQ